MQYNPNNDGYLSLPVLFIVVLSVLGLTFAAPVSQNGTALTRRATEPCYYGAKLTSDDYTNYLGIFYPARDHYILSAANSEAQATNFQSITGGYFQFADCFDSTVSKHYLTQWPQDENGCYRPDDGVAASFSMAAYATGEILVFGGVEYETKGPDSFFTKYEVPTLHDRINAGTLNKITHMSLDATTPSDILATEDGSGKITYADGQTPGTSNASGSFGDCSETLDPPTCDIPSADKIH